MRYLASENQIFLILLHLHTHHGIASRLFCWFATLLNAVSLASLRKFWFSSPFSKKANSKKRFIIGLHGRCEIRFIRLLKASSVKWRIRQLIPTLNHCAGVALLLEMSKVTSHHNRHLSFLTTFWSAVIKLCRDSNAALRGWALVQFPAWFCSTLI